VLHGMLGVVFHNPLTEHRRMQQSLMHDVLVVSPAAAYGDTPRSSVRITELTSLGTYCNRIISIGLLRPYVSILFDNTKVLA
jgi:hypothetical protein